MSATRIEPQPLALPAAWTPDQLPCGWLQFDDAGLLCASNRHFASAHGRGSAALHGQALASCLSADSRLYFTTVILPCLRAQGRVDDATLVFSGDHGDWVVSACMHRDPGSARPLTTAILTPASARAAAAQALPSQAEVDPLTQLPNRTRLLQRLQEGIDAGSHLAVMFMDLDRFKQINDSLGHEAGDQLLQLVAQRLRHQLRSTDAALRLQEGLGPAPNAALDEAMAARLGGDEFVVVLDGLADDSAAQSVADRLIEALRQPYQVAGHEIVSEVSMGIVMGDIGSTPAQLLRDADTAMYEAKRNGRGRWAQFNAAMHERVATAMALEADLRDALRCHQVRVVFQPIVEIASGRITGMEALARWRHPLRGEVSPLVFIPIAEESGLIGELGERVLSLSCQVFVAWQRAQVPLPQRLSVNLSRAQLQSRGLAARISSVLAQAGMPASALQLEVTESLAMQDESVRSSMLALRELGVQLALDDFGTGHSSLAALNEFPVQQVKIDRSFVRQIETSAYHRALVQACLQVAQALSLEVVAEGVQTEAQARLLSDLGCSRAQGYLYARPLEVDGMEAFLRSDGARAMARCSGSDTLGAVHSRAHQVVVTDAAGRTTYVNAAFTLNSGYTSQDMEGHAPGFLLQGADTDPRAKALLRDAVQTGNGCVGVEILNYRKDGRPFWVAIDIEPVRNASGAIVQFVSLQTDISARRRERAELADLRRRIEAVQATGLISFWERDLHSGEAKLDDAGRKILGLRPDEPVPSRAELALRMTPETRPALGRYVAELNAGKPAGVFEYSVQHPQGHEVQLQVLWTRVGQRLLGVMVDVSGTAQARSVRALLLSQLELAASAAHQVFWSHDLETGMVDFLPRSQTLFPTDDQGRSSALAVRSAALPEDRAAVQRARAQAATQAGVIELEYRVRNLAGDVRHQLSRRIGVPDADGVVRRIVGVSMDVTVQHEREQARDRAAQRQSRILDAARVGGFRFDVATRCFEVDTQFNQIYGLPPQTQHLSADDWLALIHPEDREGVRQASKRLLGGAAARPRDLGFRILRPDGEQRSIVSCRMPQADDKGRIVALYGAHRDATPQT